MAITRPSLQSLILIFFSFFLFGCEQKITVPQTTYAFDDFIESREVIIEAADLWSKVKKDVHVKQTGNNDALSDKFLNLQFLFESNISVMLKQNIIKKAIAVNYDNTAPLQLRISENNYSALPKISSDEEQKNNIYKLLKNSIADYLTSNTLHVIREKTDSDILGTDIYKQNIAKYEGKILDNAIDKVDSSFSGISYLLESSQDEQIVLFSIIKKQDSDSQNATWELYYGTTEQRKISDHLSKLQQTYATAGVKFTLP